MSPRSLLLLLATVVLLTSAFLYARGRRPSAEERLELALKNAGTQRVVVFPLAGSVMVDGQPSSGASTVLVMLSDPNKRQSKRCQRPIKIERT
jgi:hypothetical protein